MVYSIFWKPMESTLKLHLNKKWIYISKYSCWKRSNLSKNKRGSWTQWIDIEARILQIFMLITASAVSSFGASCAIPNKGKPQSASHIISAWRRVNHRPCTHQEWREERVWAHRERIMMGCRVILEERRKNFQVIMQVGRTLWGVNQYFVLAAAVTWLSAPLASISTVTFVCGKKKHPVIARL